MRELKILTMIFVAGLAGTVICFGGSVYGVFQEKKVRQEATLPEAEIAVPALSQ